MRVPSLLTPEAARPCQPALCIAIAKFISPAALCLGTTVPSFLPPEAAALADWSLQLYRQIYFTSRTLSGNVSHFALDAGSRPPLPTGPCIDIATFISLAALCLGT